jgi:hypothetical protein
VKGSSGGKRGKSVAPAALAAVAQHPKRLRPLVLSDVPADREERGPHWSFALADHSHDEKWSWSWVGDHVGSLLPFLAQMERLTWREIRQQKVPSAGNRMRRRFHGHSVESLPTAARKRLEELELDDVDEVFRFRLSNKERLWGIFVPQSHVFCLLWWDPNHQVYPVDT